MSKEEYEKLLKEVDTRLAEIVDEMSAAIGTLKNDERFVRTRLLIAFSFSEIVCNLYNAYFNLGLANRQLMEKWFKEYCLTDKNPTYKKHHYLGMVDEAFMYKFRCAIVHTFGLPEPENGVSITVPNGIETSEVIKKMDEGFSKRGHKVAFISADSLTQLFIDGFTLMHPEVFKKVEVATQPDFDGLERISKEFERRGARGVPLDGRSA
ncbi:MAG: hypothetical protein ABSF47_01830 [Minisyncoccia bacterium]|jgi:hypothetical protein